MASPRLTPLVVIEIALKSLQNGSTTKTIYVSNLALRDSPEIRPILTQIPSVGSFLDTYLPQQTRSNLSIDNSPGSFGFERRFSDLLTRFTIINQTVKVYLKYLTSEETSYTPDSGDLIWRSTAISYIETHGEDARVDIQLSSEQLNRDVLNYQLNTNYIDSSILGSGCPPEAIGRYLPIVFGSSVDVKPISVTTPIDSDDDVHFLYATTFESQFPVEGINDLYVKYEDSYYPVDSAAGTTTRLFDTRSGTIATIITGNDETPRARYLSTSGLNYILVQAEAIFTAGVSGAEGELRMEIWALGINGLPKTLIGTASRDKTDFTWGSGNVTVPFVFDRPVPLVDPGGVYIAYVSQTSINSTSPLDLTHDNALSGEPSLFRSEDGTWGFHYFNQKPFASAFYGVVISDEPDGATSLDPNTGLSAAYFTLSQKTALTGLESPDLRSLDMVANIDGIIDGAFGGGTITGVNATLLEAPLHIAKLLDHEFDGAAWVTGDFDFTKYSTSHSGTIDGATAPYQRVLSGRIEGPATRDFIFSEVCRNSACRVVSFAGSSKSLGIYAWGKNVASTRTIDEEDCRVRRVEVRGSDSVANWLTIRYSANLRYLTPLDFITAQQSRDLYGIKQLFVNCPEFAALGNEMLGVSNSLFGRRDNANPDYRLLNADASVALMLKYLAARYAIPDVYVTVEILDLNKYRALDMLDVVTISSPVLGSFFGTSSDADYPQHDGEVVDLVPGEYWRRAEFVRMQIEGREIFFTENSPPWLRLLCRVLNNYPKDPT